MIKLLVYLAVKYQGDYTKIKKALDTQEKVDENLVEETLASLNCKYTTILSDDYPIALRQLKDPPYVLFYYGNLDLVKSPSISVIGMRQPSDYGKIATKKFINGLTKYDISIVSGLALGIDAIAHKTAIANNGNTIAVLGSGIDYCYPKTNYQLYHLIKEHHLILSEYPNDVKPKPYFFPFRNRIVAALSKAILVIEAKRKSGTMITVGYGLDLGKPIFSVPGSIFSHLGTHELIRQGAILVNSALEIIEDL